MKFFKVQEMKIIKYKQCKENIENISKNNIIELKSVLNIQ